MDKLRSLPKKNWTSENILDELRVAKNLSAKFQQRTNAKLYGAAVRYFGSWKAAVEATGISYDAIVKRELPGYWDANRCIEARTTADGDKLRPSSQNI